MRLSKAEIVVGADIECTALASREVERAVVIMRDPLQRHDRAATHTSHGPFETVVDARLEASGKETVEVRIESRVPIVLTQMREFLRVEAAPNKVASVPKQDQHNVHEVRRKHCQVARCILLRALKLARIIPRRPPERILFALSKFRVLQTRLLGQATSGWRMQCIRHAHGRQTRGGRVRPESPAILPCRPNESPRTAHRTAYDPRQRGKAHAYELHLDTAGYSRPS